MFLFVTYKKSIFIVFIIFALLITYNLSESKGEVMTNLSDIYKITKNFRGVAAHGYCRPTLKNLLSIDPTAKFEPIWCAGGGAPSWFPPASWQGYPVWPGAPEDEPDYPPPYYPKEGLVAWPSEELPYTGVVVSEDTSTFEIVYKTGGPFTLDLTHSTASESTTAAWGANQGADTVFTSDLGEPSVVTIAKTMPVEVETVVNLDIENKTTVVGLKSRSASVAIYTNELAELVNLEVIDFRNGSLLGNISDLNALTELWSLDFSSLDQSQLTGSWSDVTLSNFGEFYMDGPTSATGNLNFLQYNTYVGAEFWVDTFTTGNLTVDLAYIHNAIGGWSYFGLDDVTSATCSTVTAAHIDNNTYYEATNCGMTQSDIDNILASIDLGGGTGIEIDLTGNTYPSAAGEVSIAALEAKGCIVKYDAIPVVEPTYPDVTEPQTQVWKQYAEPGDGYTSNYTTPWATARNAEVASESASDDVNATAMSASPLSSGFIVGRSHFEFDLSNFSATGRTIQSVALDLAGHGYEESTVQVQQSTFTGTVVAEDFNAFTGPMFLDTPKTWSLWDGGQVARNVMPFNTAGQTYVTTNFGSSVKLCTREAAHDVANVQPTGNNRCGAYYSEAGRDGFPYIKTPRLVITYLKVEEWTEYTDNTKWATNNGATYNGTAWVPGGSDISLSPIGSWATGYKPYKIRLTFSGAATVWVQLWNTDRYNKLINRNVTSGEEIILDNYNNLDLDLLEVFGGVNIQRIEFLEA